MKLVTESLIKGRRYKKLNNEDDKEHLIKETSKDKENLMSNSGTIKQNHDKITEASKSPTNGKNNLTIYENLKHRDKILNKNLDVFLVKHLKISEKDKKNSNSPKIDVSNETLKKFLNLKMRKVTNVERKKTEKSAIVESAILILKNIIEKQKNTKVENAQKITSTPRSRLPKKENVLPKYESQEKLHPSTSGITSKTQNISENSSKDHKLLSKIPSLSKNESNLTTQIRIETLLSRSQNRESGCTQSVKRMTTKTISGFPPKVQNISGTQYPLKKGSKLKLPGISRRSIQSECISRLKGIIDKCKASKLTTMDNREVKQNNLKESVENNEKCLNESVEYEEVHIYSEISEEHKANKREKLTKVQNLENEPKENRSETSEVNSSKRIIDNFNRNRKFFEENYGLSTIDEENSMQVLENDKKYESELANLEKFYDCNQNISSKSEIKAPHDPTDNKIDHPLDSSKTSSKFVEISTRNYSDLNSTFDVSSDEENHESSFISNRSPLDILNKTFEMLPQTSSMMTQSSVSCSKDSLLKQIEDLRRENYNKTIQIEQMRTDEKIKDKQLLKALKIADKKFSEVTKRENLLKFVKIQSEVYNKVVQANSKLNLKTKEVEMLKEEMDLKDEKIHELEKLLKIKTFENKTQEHTISELEGKLRLRANEIELLKKCWEESHEFACQTYERKRKEWKQKVSELNQVISSLELQDGKE